MKSKGLMGCFKGEDVFAQKRVSIYDIETHERTDFDSVKECARYFGCEASAISCAIIRKTRRKHNGKKYAIRFNHDTPNPRNN